MKLTRFTFEILVDTSDEIKEAKANCLLKYIRNCYGIGRYSKEKLEEITVTDHNVEMIQHYRRFGFWPDSISPKKIGSNEYKRIHKKLCRQMDMMMEAGA